MSFADQRRSRYAVAIPTRQLLAAAMVLIAMWTFYLSSHGLWGNGDWIGYRTMYLSGGDYLRVQGRDPLFVWLISVAASVFGYGGYESFRNLTFTFFTLVAARWAYLARGAVAVTALTIFDLTINKSVIQIRECLAFMILTAPLVGIYAHRRQTVVSRQRSIILALLCGIVAGLIHLGTSVFLLIWIGAAFLTAIPRKYLEWRFTPRALLIIGIAAGSALGSLIIVFPHPFVALLVELAGGAYSTPQLFILKIVFWMVLGILTFVTGGQLVSATQGSNAFGYAYAILLGRFVLPLVFSATALLVWTSFSTPEVTQWGVRILASALQLGMIIITVRGRASLITLIFSMLLLGNEARAFIPTWGLYPPV